MTRPKTILPDWIKATLAANWQNAVANRGAFWVMMVLMAVQNLIYMALWVIIFAQLSSLKGWGLREVAFIYGGGAMGYGLLFTCFGGLNQLADTIRSGELDLFLARPRSVLLSACLRRARADSLGDVISGALMLLYFARPALGDFPLILLLSFSAGIVYFSFRLVMHSLAFWGLTGEGSENGFVAFLIAATNPLNGFGTWGKILLLTLFPAGYIAWLPVEIMRDFSWSFLAWQLGATLAFFALAIGIFHYGLRRYASGNQFLLLR